MGFLRKLIGLVSILKGAFRVPATGLVVAFFVVLGSGPMSLSSKFVLFRGFPMGFVHGGHFSAVLIDGAVGARGRSSASAISHGFENCNLLAMSRFGAEGVAEFFRGCRSLNVGGQNLTIGGFAPVEFPVGFLIRAKSGAFKRNACKQSARSGIRKHFRVHHGVRLGSGAAAHRAGCSGGISTQREFIR